ncbi:hypothetical protein P4200_29880 [Pseudomonas aeruginosa]|nr:hypothetical protein [Pseudomonas aeruginosa]
MWAVTNGPNELLALSRDGDVERRYSLDVASTTWKRCPRRQRSTGHCRRAAAEPGYRGYPHRRIR